jgi:IclR family acetate operon transcriptional repressor
MLRAYGRKPSGSGVRELARELDISKSTLQRIAVSLERGGLLAYDPASRRYGLGAGVLELAAAYRRSTDFYAVAQEHLAKVAEETGETVCLALIAGTARVNAVQVESTQHLRFSGEVGRPFSLARGASSRALLAQLEDDERAAVLDRLELAGKARADLEEGIRELLRRGYSVSRGEITAGGTAIAVPLPGARRAAVALSLYAPDARMPRGRIGATAEILVAAAAALQRVLPEPPAAATSATHGAHDDME